MRYRLTGLWQHRDFMKLWFGQTISEFGSQITGLALPLTAVTILQATPAQMGLLNALQFSPFLLIGLLAGTWGGRGRRRPVLIWTDVGRTLLLAAIPAAALLGVLRIEFLYVVGVLVGVMTVFFDVAYQAFLPSLVSREQLVEGNSKLQVTASAAQIAGPGVTGGLMQIMSAPLTILFDAVSFLVSAVSLVFVRAHEPAAELKKQDRPGFWKEVGEGMQVVLGNPLLRSIAATTATANLFYHTIFAVFMIHATRTLGLTPGALGVVFAAGNVGFVVGALFAGRVADRLGLGRTIVLSIAIGGLAMSAIPLAPPQPLLAAAVLILGQLVGSCSLPIYNINQVSLRQAITPERLQGRMNATMRFIVWGTIPLGSLLGGALGTFLGLWPTLWVGAAGSACAFLWIYFSPVRKLEKMPEPVSEPTPLAEQA